MFRRIVGVGVFVLFAACSSGGDDSEGGGDGGGSEPAGWLEQWPGELDDYEGHPVKIDDAERMVYVQDCDVAREMTAVGGAYGPSGGNNGYAYICE